MEKILKIKYVSLPNLIADRRIIPEMLMHECNPKAVGRELHNILPGSPGHDNQLDATPTCGNGSARRMPPTRLHA